VFHAKADWNRIHSYTTLEPVCGTMTTMHPFARSPIRERSTSTASSAYFPGGYDNNEQDDRREEEEDALRMMAYGEGTLSGGYSNEGRREKVERRTEAEGSSSGSRSFKRVPRSPPPQGPPRQCR
jgi:hypothetical protein